MTRTMDSYMSLGSDMTLGLNVSGSLAFIWTLHRPVSHGSVDSINLDHRGQRPKTHMSLRPLVSLFPHPSFSGGAKAPYAVSVQLLVHYCSECESMAERTRRYRKFWNSSSVNACSSHELNDASYSQTG